MAHVTRRSFVYATTVHISLKVKYYLKCNRIKILYLCNQYWFVKVNNSILLNEFKKRKWEISFTFFLLYEN